MKLVWKVLITAGALWVAVWVVPGLGFSGEPWAWFVVSLLIVLANWIVKPILNILSLPLILLTLGLFLLVTNAAVLQFVVWLSAPDRLDLGLTSTGFFWATFLGALVVGLVRTALDKLDR